MRGGPYIANAFFFFLINFTPRVFRRVSTYSSGYGGRAETQHSLRTVWILWWPAHWGVTRAQWPKCWLSENKLFFTLFINCTRVGLCSTRGCPLCRISTPRGGTRDSRTRIPDLSLFVFLLLSFLLWPPSRRMARNKDLYFCFKQCWFSTFPASGENSSTREAILMKACTASFSLVRLTQLVESRRLSNLALARTTMFHKTRLI